MQIFFTVLHVTVCIILILVILLQAGKGANMGAAFGGSSQTVFGSSGPAGFLGKMTTVVAILFMITSLTLSYSAVHKGKTLMSGAAKPGVEQQAAPVQPQPQAAQTPGAAPAGKTEQPAPAAPQQAK
ncbi:MAG: preprotein translocase subunit SecG [Syntrophus sp. (in: bacteria)]|nr:preprotein translocase subunit SecG [Syntrophus sp. (in: bacteria)]